MQDDADHARITLLYKQQKKILIDLRILEPSHLGATRRNMAYLWLVFTCVRGQLRGTADGHLTVGECVEPAPIFCRHAIAFTQVRLRARYIAVTHPHFLRKVKQEM